jgi:hypothetical protein
MGGRSATDRADRWQAGVSRQSQTNQAMSSASIPALTPRSRPSGSWGAPRGGPACRCAARSDRTGSSRPRRWSTAGMPQPRPMNCGIRPNCASSTWRSWRLRRSMEQPGQRPCRVQAFRAGASRLVAHHVDRPLPAGAKVTIDGRDYGTRRGTSGCSGMVQLYQRTGPALEQAVHGSGPDRRDARPRHCLPGLTFGGLRLVVTPRRTIC